MPVQGVQRALLPAGGAATSGHVTLLKQKALTAILRRLDALLFGKLLAGMSNAAIVYFTAHRHGRPHGMKCGFPQISTLCLWQDNLVSATPVLEVIGYHDLQLSQEVIV